MFVVLFIVALLVLMGLVVDGGAALTARQAATDEAEQAARAGAGSLSTSALRSGTVVLDPATAVKVAEAFTVAVGHPGTATVSGGVVTVTVQYRIGTSLLGIVGVDTLPVAGSASAVDVSGVTGATP